jgi:quaternary ammonium compound-resistance protein SugE
MPWIVLLASAVLEAVWASALAASDGLRVLVPSLVFLVAGTLSMLGLAHAVRTIPIGTAYAVWTGIGAALTVAWAMTFGEEPFSVVKVVLLAGIVGAVIGLKLVGHDSGTSSDSGSSGPEASPRQATPD